MKLVSMYGRPRVGKCGQSLGAPQYQFSLFSLMGNQGPMDEILSIDPRELDPVDAGVQTLYAFAKAKPGATWADIVAFSQGLSLGRKWYERLGSMIGNGIADAGDKIGDWTGAGIRLLTNKEVMSGVSQYAGAFATGGASAGVMGMLQNLGGSESGLSAGNIKDLLSSIGLKTQQNVQAAGINIGQWDPKILAIAGGALVLVLLLLK